MLNAKNNNLQIHNFEMTQKHFHRPMSKTQQLDKKIQYNKLLKKTFIVQTKHFKRQHADGTIKLEENRNAYTDKAIISNDDKYSHNSQSFETKSSNHCGRTIRLTNKAKNINEQVN